MSFCCRQELLSHLFAWCLKWRQMHSRAIVLTWFLSSDGLKSNLLHQFLLWYGLTLRGHEAYTVDHSSPLLCRALSSGGWYSFCQISFCRHMKPASSSCLDGEQIMLTFHLYQSLPSILLGYPFCRAHGTNDGKIILESPFCQLNWGEIPIHGYAATLDTVVLIELCD